MTNKVSNINKLSLLLSVAIVFSLESRALGYRADVKTVVSDANTALANRLFLDVALPLAAKAVSRD